MYDRRTVLATSGTLLAGLAGCLSTGDDAGTDTRTTGLSTGTRTDTTTDEPTSETTTDADLEELSDWENLWYESWEYNNALGLDPFDGTAYVTASSEEGGPSATIAVDPADGSTLWQTEHEGEAVGRSYVMHNEGDDQWGVTITDGTVFSVNGVVDDYEWSALHALDRATGERRWELRRDRLLGVVGAFDGVVFVLAQDFFEPEHTHQEPEPRSMSVFGVNVDTGAVRWDETVTAARSTAAADADGVYFVADDRLLAFAHDGTRQGERTLPTNDAQLTVAEDGRYLLQSSETVTRVSGIAADGTRRWSHENSVYNRLAFDDVLYVDRPSVSALGSDGTIRWQTDSAGGDFLVSPTGSEVYVVTGRETDAISARSAADGTEMWQFDANLRHAWPAAATSETVVVEAMSDPGYTLYAVDAASGEPLARLAAVHSFAVEGVGDRVLVADGVGGVQALSAQP